MRTRITRQACRVVAVDVTGEVECVSGGLGRDSWVVLADSVGWHPVPHQPGDRVVRHPSPSDDRYSALCLRVDGQAGPGLEEIGDQDSGADGEGLDDVADHCDELQLARVRAQVHGFAAGEQLDISSLV
jgi:hypothetical protein